jgi:hypothetical protein
MDNKEQTKPIKPMCLKLDEAERAIIDAINNSGVPYYLLEPIVHSAARRVTECANAERARARQTYDKELEEYNKSEVCNDGLGTRKEAN